MVTTRFNALNRPGTFLTETTGGFRTPELGSHNTVYMLGSSSVGEFAAPTLVSSAKDFTNQFGSSPSLKNVELYFDNDSAGKLYFIRVQQSALFEIELDTINTGDDIITINGVAVEIALLGADTVEEAVDKYIIALNASGVADVITATALGGNLIAIRVDVPGTELTVTGSADVIVTNATGTLPNAYDYVYSLQNTFDALGIINFEQGYLIAPEAFENLASQNDRLSVGVAMENLCADAQADWVALVDCGAVHGTVAQVQADGLQYTTAKGHLAYYAPYVVNLADVQLPASAGVAGIATKRNREQGFQEAPAGTRYRMAGVKDVSVKFGNQAQDVLNPNGINLVRYMFNTGVVVWGARTRSSDSLYTFVHTRVIMNVLNGTLRGAFDNDIFSTIDGAGALFARIKETARSVCRRLWLGKALYGATEADAFDVVCGMENNDAGDLDNGNVALEVYVATSPTLEKLSVGTIRVGIGQVASSAAAANSLA